jgi:hypothetical protein
VGDGNGLGDDRIDEIELDNDSDCSNEPEDYSTPQSMAEQADSEVSSESNQTATPSEPFIKPVSSESSSSRAETPSFSSSEPSQPSQRRTRYGRAIISSEEARQSRQQRNQATRESNFAIQSVFISFYASLIHRLHRRDLSSALRGWKDMQKHSHK